MNVGAFIAAALLLDVVLWLCVLLGIEAVVIPADFRATHQPEFAFPLSHGLAAGASWSVLAGAGVLAVGRRCAGFRPRTAALVSTAVFSHWLLDALVHGPELPVCGASSTKVGLGLWQDMPLALLVESAVLVAGLLLFLPGAGMSRVKKVCLTALCLLVLAFTVAGMTVAPPPPSADVMASSSLGTIGIVSALACWLAKPRRP